MQKPGHGTGPASVPCDKAERHTAIRQEDKTKEPTRALK